MFESTAGPDRGGWRRGLAFAALFLLIFLVNIGASLNTGRLSGVPFYDDASYLVDALDRVLFPVGGGLRSVLVSFWQGPPHAPLTTLTGMAGFSLFGPADLSAYLANAWVLVLFLATVAWLSRPLGNLAERLLLVGLVAFLPITQALVTEFRPDPAAGLLFALALITICRTDFRVAGIGRLILLAAVCVLVALAKPSAIVLSIPGLGVAGLTTLLAQGWHSPGKRARLAGAALVVLLAFVVMMVPFAIVFGPNTLAYIRNVLVTNADVWRTPGDGWFHATYHLTGVGGTLAMGVFTPVLAALVVADLVVYALRPAYRRPGVLPFTITLAVVYAAMANSNEKTVFQGSFFYLPFVLAGVSAFVRLAAEAKRCWPVPAARALPAGLAAGLALSVLLLPASGSYNKRPHDRIEAERLRDAIADTIVRVYREEWSGNPACRDRVMRVAVTQPQPLTAEAIRMAVARRGVRILQAVLYTTRTEEDAEQILDGIEFVGVADPATPYLDEPLPVLKLVPALLAHLQSRPGVQSFDVGRYHGKPYRLFVNPQCEPKPFVHGETPD